MTCIIGFTDKEHGVSWIGGDSLGSNGYTKSSELSAKVFRNELFKNVLIGGTTTFRHLDLLRYSETCLMRWTSTKSRKLTISSWSQSSSQRL